METKRETYEALMPQIEALVSGETDLIANMANVAAVLHDAMGYWGTTLVLLGAIVIDVLMLTHWSLSRGAQKVGSKAQVLGKKTGEKIEAAATRLREKKAALDAARSAARLEVLDDKPTEFIYKKNE